MNEKGKADKKTYIILAVLLTITLIIIFVMLELAKKSEVPKPYKEDVTTTTTTTTKNTDESTTTTTTTALIQEDDPEEPIVVNNFMASLEEITYGLSLEYDYAASTRYSGARFNFNCTNYDAENFVCLEGSGLIDIGTAMLPLYTYTSENGNYLNHLEDYYIILNERYLVLVYNESGKKAGEAKFYDRSGKYLGTVDNVITGYKENKKLYNRVYPNITGNIFTYYMCDKNSVTISSVGLNSLKDYKVLENLESATCY